MPSRNTPINLSKVAPQLPIERCLMRAQRNGAKAGAASLKRKLVDPTTTERDYSPDELELLRAVERYKAEAHRPFPTITEILGVMKSLGYRKP